MANIVDRLGPTISRPTPGQKCLYAALRSSDGLIKIGMSVNPKARVSGLAGLRLLYASRPTIWPRTAENIAHGVLKCYGRHVHGEFFCVSLDQAKGIIDGALDSVATGAIEHFVMGGVIWDSKVAVDRLPWLVPSCDEGRKDGQ